MKRVINVVCGLSSILLLCNCDDIFEEDISDDTVTILSPKQDDVITGNTVTFTWNTLEGADNYNVQVSRANTLEIILDSLVVNTSLTVPFPSGEFDWKVRAENFAYTSSYSFPESFLVESSDDLSEQHIFLNSPSDNFYTKNNTIILSWSGLEAAESYSLLINKTIGNNSSVILKEEEISNTTYIIDFNILEEDAIYKWSIKAVNETSETPFSSRTIFLDTMVPNQPALISPNNSETVTTTVDFSWNSGQDVGAVQSPLNSILEIAADENFSSILQTYSMDGGSGEKQHSFSDIGDYFWRVRIEDEAGNQSPYSVVKSIAVE